MFEAVVWVQILLNWSCKVRMYVNPKSSFNSYVLRSRKEYGLVSRHRLQLLRSTNLDGQDQDDIRRVTYVNIMHYISTCQKGANFRVTKTINRYVWNLFSL